MDLSDGSDNDSDYNSIDAERDLDADEELELDNVPKLEQALVRLTGRRKHAVNDVWRALRLEDEQSIVQRMEAAQKISFGLFATIAMRGTSPVPTHLSREARTRRDPLPAQATTTTEKSSNSSSSSSSSGSNNKKHAPTAPANAPAPALAGAASSKVKVVKAARNAKQKAALPNKSNAKTSGAEVGRRQRLVLTRLFGREVAAKLIDRCRSGTDGLDWGASEAESRASSSENSARSKGKDAGTGKGKGKGKGAKAGKSVETEAAPAPAPDVSSVALRLSGSNAPKPAAFRRRPASAALRSAVSQALRGIRRKTVIKETRRFAGQAVEVERTEMVAVVKDQFEEDERREAEKAKDASASAGTGKAKDGSGKSAGGGGGLDSLLATIKGPQAITTVTKSAFDWQTHKAKEGLEDELKDAAKAGYLSRKDFLERVDVRTYEKERDARIIEQASRKK
jgi:hypothetical protein